MLGSGREFPPEASNAVDPRPTPREHAFPEAEVDDDDDDVDGTAMLLLPVFELNTSKGLP